MAVNDPTSDMIATIRNGQAANIARISAISNLLNKNVCEVLKSEGFINGYEEEEVKKGVKKLNIDLKYFGGQPVIRKLKRVSTPGRRVYSDIKSLKRSFNGLGITIISTSHGVLPDHEARKFNVGGEVICEVF